MRDRTGATGRLDDVKPLFTKLKIVGVGVLLAGSMAAMQAESISGVVTNKTTGKPAGNDDVVLLRLAQGMQESARTKTDARGRYTIEVPEQGLHLVRVTHDKANYFKPVQPGAQGAVDVDVYTAVAKVTGVVGEADVIRLQTDESGKTLKIVENFFVRNDSSPPMTQFSEKPFEFYLPAGAVVLGSAALSPGGMPVQAAPVPLGDPNHYAFIFPIRPGETRFQVTYTIPYAGSLQLTPKPVMVTDTIAVMMPKSMTFKGGNSTSYSPVTEETTAQTFVVRNASPSQPLSFTVSGSGQMPRDTPAPTADTGSGGATGGQDAAGGGGTAANDTRPGGGLGNPVDPGATNDPWAKYRWWILGGLGLVLAAGAGVMLKRPAGGPVATGAGGPRHTGAAGAGDSTLTVLKEEMFALETERLQGKISEAEYAEHKLALEQVLRRVLGRSAGAGGAATVKPEPMAADLVARSGLKS